MRESFFENILSHVDESLFVLDKNGSIVYVNDYLLRHGIMTKEETLSLNSNTMFSSGQTNVNIWKLVNEKKQSVTALQTISTLMGEKSLSCLVTQVPIMDEHGEVELSVGIIRDISDYQYKLYCAHQSESHVFHPAFTAAPVTPGSIVRPVYRSQKMEELFRVADVVAASDATVLIQGESGVGKEVLASYLHRASPRRGRKMVAVNCAELHESLLESELFGYEKGAFTGASHSGKKGLIEEAEGSTLFLDEVNSMPLAFQAKLLRVLETHEVRRVGGQTGKKVNFRIIAATNADLEKMVADHQFREDLYYRLNILPMTIPPLRDRKEDIPLLANDFLVNFGKKYGHYKQLSDKSLNKMMEYHWPGNIRELRNFMERLVLMTDISAHEIKDIPDAFFAHQSAPPPEMPARPPKTDSLLREGKSLKEQIARLEAELIEEAVARYGSYTKAANALGTSKSTLLRKHGRCQK